MAYIGQRYFFLKMTILTLADVQVIWITFCGSRNRKEKEKTEPDTPQWNKNRKILAFVLFKEAVCCSHELYSFLSVSGGISIWLWLAALDKARVQAHVSDVIPIQNPG